MGFGRVGAICEYDIIMQILPGSSDDVGLIDVSEQLCNGSKRRRMAELGGTSYILNLSRGSN